jgi:hypothetical protein
MAVPMGRRRPPRGLTVGQWLEKRVNEWISDGKRVRSAHVSLSFQLGLTSGGRIAGAVQANTTSLAPPPRTNRRIGGIAA